MSEIDLKTKFKLGSEVIQGLFESGKSPLSDQFIRWKIWARWNEIVGQTISQHSEPVGYRFGVLYIWVPSSSWMQQMHFMKGQIKDVVNRKLGRVYIKDIKLTLDRKEVPHTEEQQKEFKKIVETLAPQREDFE